MHGNDAGVDLSGFVPGHLLFFQDYIRLEINADIYRTAAELRARHGLKTPDALHLSTAQSHGCAGFWTNDERLHAVAGQLAVNVLDRI